MRTRHKKTRRGKRGKGIAQSNPQLQQRQEQTVINISDASLSEDETSVLSKGLSFSPTNRIDPFKLKVDAFKFFRQLHLKQFFS